VLSQIQNSTWTYYVPLPSNKHKFRSQHSKHFERVDELPTENLVANVFNELQKMKSLFTTPSNQNNDEFVDEEAVENEDNNQHYIQNLSQELQLLSVSTVLEERQEQNFDSYLIETQESQPRWVSEHELALMDGGNEALDKYYDDLVS